MIRILGSSLMQREERSVRRRQIDEFSPECIHTHVKCIESARGYCYAYMRWKKEREREREGRASTLSSILVWY